MLLTPAAKPSAPDGATSATPSPPEPCRVSLLAITKEAARGGRDRSAQTEGQVVAARPPRPNPKTVRRLRRKRAEHQFRQKIEGKLGDLERQVHKLDAHLNAQARIAALRQMVRRPSRDNALCNAPRSSPATLSSRQRGSGGRPRVRRTTRTSRASRAGPGGDPPRAEGDDEPPKELLEDYLGRLGPDGETEQAVAARNLAAMLSAPSFGRFEALLAGYHPAVAAEVFGQLPPAVQKECWDRLREECEREALEEQGIARAGAE